jgi:hydroxyacylglutathione hydrolase
MPIVLDSAPLWYFQTNTYVVAPERGGPAVVIDAPPDGRGIDDLLARHDLTPVAVMITHGHVDHAGGVDHLASPTVRAFLHPADVDMARHPGDQLRTLLGVSLADPTESVVTTEFVDLVADAVVEAAGLDLRVVFTPGHTPGHCCFLLASEGVLFSGDHLFAGSIGRTDLPGGSYPQLMDSMVNQILPLPVDTVVHPGHGPSTTLAAERRHNPFLQELL